MSEKNDLSSLYVTLRERLTRSLSGVVPPKEIEDIVQEAYVRICQVDQSTSIQTPTAYLFRTVRNLALDYLKRSESRLCDSLEVGDEHLNGLEDALPDETFEHVASREEFALFCEAVRLLPVQARRAFVLRKVYGYSQSEIALEMQLSESTVEKHIALGLKRCMHFMRESFLGKRGETCGRTSQKKATESFL